MASQCRNSKNYYNRNKDKMEFKAKKRLWNRTYKLKKLTKIEDDKK